MDNKKSCSFGLNPISEILSEAKTSEHAQDVDDNVRDEQGSSRREGLSERIAARAGFRYAKLNTECVRRPFGSFLSSDVRSPYIITSPGFSPTMLLQTPNLVSNPLVHPSPSTGKFPIVDGGSIDKGTLFRDIREVDDYKHVLDDFHLSSLAPLVQETTVQVIPSSLTAQEQSFPENDISSSRNQKSEAVILNDHASGSFMNIPKTKDTKTCQSQDKDDWIKYGETQMNGSCEFPNIFTISSNRVSAEMVETCSGETHQTVITNNGTYDHQNLDLGSPFIEGSNDETEEADYFMSETMEAQFDPITDAPLLISDEAEDSGGNNDGDSRVVHGSSNYTVHGSDSEEVDSPKPKKRKLEASSLIGATRAARQPRIIVRTTSDVDVLDDGYRWRKYGQKVVKGNPNPRSYYKCTASGCNVRKHVERAAHDIESVITTYEGKHNHDVPPPRTGGHAASTARSAIQQPPVLSGLGTRIARPSPLSPLGMTHRSGPSSGAYFGMRQTSLANLYITGLSKLPGLPMNRPPVFMLPTIEPETKPVSVPPLSMSNGSSVYQEIMNRLSLGL